MFQSYFCDPSTSSSGISPEDLSEILPEVPPGISEDVNFGILEGCKDLLEESQNEVQQFLKLQEKSSQVNLQDFSGEKNFLEESHTKCVGELWKYLDIPRITHREISK